MRSACGQSPSLTSSSAWTRWRNLSGPQPPCYPAWRRFPWTKHHHCTSDGKRFLVTTPSVSTGPAEAPPTGLRCSWKSQQAAIFVFKRIYPGRRCSEHARFQHNPATCVQLQSIQKSNVSLLATDQLRWSNLESLSCSRAPWKFVWKRRKNLSDTWICLKLLRVILQTTLLHHCKVPYTVPPLTSTWS